MGSLYQALKQAKKEHGAYDVVLDPKLVQWASAEIKEAALTMVEGIFLYVVRCINKPAGDPEAMKLETARARVSEQFRIMPHYQIMCEDIQPLLWERTLAITRGD